jgi:hypothetical protein
MLKKIATFLSNLGQLWLSKAYFYPLLFSVLSIVIQATTISFYLPQLPPVVPLYYSRPWGTSQLTGPYSLFILPAFCLGGLLINSALVVLLLGKRKFLSICLMWTNVIINILSLVTLFKIVLLIT